MTDSVFAGTDIILVAYNEQGAVGVIYNKPFGRSLHELDAFRQVPQFALYTGGPVDQEHLYFIHNCPELIQEGIFINENIYWGGNFTQVIEGIENGMILNNKVKVFVGYCGWDKGELEAEIEEGSWIVIDDASVFVE